MNLYRCNFAIAAVFVTIFVSVVGCSSNKVQQPGSSEEVDVQSSSAREIKIDPRNEFGFAKISIREVDNYQEGIVDAESKEV